MNKLGKPGAATWRPQLLRDLPWTNAHLFDSMLDAGGEPHPDISCAHFGPVNSIPTHHAATLHRRRRITARAGIRVLAWIGGVALAVNVAGCRTLARFRPADQHVIAAREMSRGGLDALRAGKLQEAETRLDHALKQCPHDAESRHSLAQVYQARGLNREAVEQMDLAVRLSGGDAAWTLELGRMLLNQGDTGVALECGQRALALAPQSGGAWTLLGDVWVARNDLASAQDAYQRALTVSPPAHEALLPLASLYETQGRPQRALATLRHYEDVMPEQERVVDLALRQGIILQTLTRHDQALAKFAVAERVMGRSPDLLLRSAESQLALGQTEMAQRSIAMARELQPNHPSLAALTSGVRQVVHEEQRP
ncbi:MAG TPA: tetratricopeptide repeat protein [Pirellulaceae bacterium]